MNETALALLRASRPRWKLTGWLREDFEQFRSAGVGFLCLPCFDTGLPCYRDEADLMSTTLTSLRAAEREAAAWRTG